MSWITVICSMNAGACLTLTAFCVAMWRKEHQIRRSLIRVGAAVTAAMISVVLAYNLPTMWGVVGIPLFFGLTCTVVVMTIGDHLGGGMRPAAQSEHALEVQEKLFNFAADFPDLFLWEWDLEKDETWVSDRWRAHLGLPGQRIKLEHLIFRCHADDRHTVQRVLNGAIEQGKDYQVEFRVRRADGSLRWVYACGHVQVDHVAKPKRLMTVCLDITERKAAEILARKQRDRREKLMQKRTAVLERQVAESARLEREVIERCAREQKQIAYDLHDGVGQQLVSIALSAKLLEEQLRPVHPDQAEKASAIVKLANETTRQARLTARSLEATGIDDLKTALESLVVNIEKNCRVKSVLRSNATALPISAPVAVQLYRITQEAVRNAIEHGAAREVLIQLTLNNHDLLLTVQDDGQGFEAKANKNGMGLRIMRHRALSIGGSCKVHSGPENGTIVSCRVPLETQPSLANIS